MLRNSLGPVKFMSIPLKTYHGALDGFIYYKWGKQRYTLATDLSPPIISSKGTPKIICGLVNVSHDKMFSSWLQSTQPEQIEFDFCCKMSKFMRTRDLKV
jgi:hypothetical protein